VKTYLQFLIQAIRRLLACLLLPAIVVFIIFITPQSNEAASGGRIGGGDFRAPSIPRNNGYGGNPGGYRYNGYGGGYRGGGLGFPFLLPIFGFGGGGLLGLLILITISGVITNALRKNESVYSYTNSSNKNIQSLTGPVTMVQVQIGLLASAQKLQTDLRELAKSIDTSTSNGLQNALQETTLALLRQPEFWVYANTETGSVPFNSAESTFNRLALNERSKLSAEITSNFAGNIDISQELGNESGEAGSTNEFIAVTIIAATKNQPSFSKTISNEQFTEDLKALGSISSNDLIAVEIIWQPEKRGDTLSREELVTTYPNLKHL
tara:strand:+ start:7716 stop:8684 length:969 start_codon:yes stop_codon:yes gene_type:complete